MSIIHFDTTNAATFNPIVMIQNVNCAAVNVGAPAEATINARSIGDVTCRINGSTVVSHDWIDPKSAAGIGDTYQVKRGASSPFDLDTNPGFGPLAGVWQNVGTSAFWGFQTPGVSTFTATFLVSIRQGSGPTLDTATWTIQITQNSGGGGGGGGCFTGNMLVLMSDGTEKLIADILVGDMVMSLNTETNKLVSARVENTMVPRICNIYKIKLSNGKTVETTIEHPFRTADGRWANIDPAATYQNATLNVDAQLREGMLIRSIEGNAKITKIIDTGRKETVYNLSRVGNHHNFFVEGMCVHNKEIVRDIF